MWRVLFGLWLLVAAGAAAAQDFPKYTGLVVDAASVLPPDRKLALEQRLEQLQQSTKRQLVVATVPSLGDDEIRDYGYKLGRQWGVGLKGADNGVILLVAPTERKVDIEVGYGLEPWLTDAFSSIVIDQTIRPRFKAGDLPGGIEAGVDALAKQLALPQDEAQAKLVAAEAEFNKTHQRSRGGSGGGIPVGLIFWGVILMVVILPMLSRRRQGGAGQRWSGGGGSNWPIVLWGLANELGSSSSRGGWGGGSFGGDSSSSSGGSDGSWGGGGFTGGGGGSFGGGGASGDW